MKFQLAFLLISLILIINIHNLNAQDSEVPDFDDVITNPKSGDNVIKGNNIHDQTQVNGKTVTTPPTTAASASAMYTEGFWLNGYILVQCLFIFMRKCNIFQSLK
ncbi:uncharacterized protein LOC119609335 [Lucilia sericata]|uniref:uncharacterized protein LOC119609335 n=1 Tax=Lucilia sericata TaxID=13632 RepID=UPI0018A8209C|nr:uncharacterized protein LOC119609335 [Lucilia sericata]